MVHANLAYYRLLILLPLTIIPQTATARIRNAFGGAETLEGNMSFGTRTKSSFNVGAISLSKTMPSNLRTSTQVRLSTPLFASPDTTLSLSAFATERDLTYFAACRESLRGVRLGLRVCVIVPRRALYTARIQPWLTTLTACPVDSSSFHRVCLRLASTSSHMMLHCAIYAM